MLSLFLFAVYIDEIMDILREKGLGCHISGVLMGACLFPENLFFLAPNRNILQEMVKECEEYGKENSLVLTTDPVPVRSKTKCTFSVKELDGFTFFL